MRIVFIDPTGWQYTADTPYESPLGGSQSALCYLAAELISLNHEVTILNGSKSDSQSRGVRISNFSSLAEPNFLTGYHIAVVINAAIAHQLRRDFRVKIPLVLWNHHAHDQPAIQALSRLRERKDWDAFAFVSDWQRERAEKHFLIHRSQTRVMRNAISPAFANIRRYPPVVRHR